MDKKTALTILIKHSFILTEEEKIKLLSKINTLTDQQIDELGRFFAIEKQKALETNKENIETIDSIIDNLEKTQSNSS